MLFIQILLEYFFPWHLGSKKETELHGLFALVAEEQHLTDSFSRNLQGQDEHISHNDNDVIEPNCLRVGYSYHRQIDSQTCPDVFPE